MDDIALLGRRVPPDWVHVSRWSLAEVRPETVATVERFVSRNVQRKHYHQHESSCVGHAASRMMTMLNGGLYDPWWLWDRAKEVDSWAETNPGDDEGTSVRAAMDVLRDIGHRPWRGNAPDHAAGISANRWATTVDEMRTCIAGDVPVTIGTNWYERMSHPERLGGEDWILGRGIDLDWGRIIGGHATTIYGASDRRQAFRLCNNWGPSWALVWIPYEVMRRLLDEFGEACVVTDR